MVEPQKERARLSLENYPDAAVWSWLCRNQNDRFGAAEESLLEQTKIRRGELLSALNRFVKAGLCECRLQQIGTGGNADHYYRLTGRGHQLVLEYELAPDTPGPQ